MSPVTTTQLRQESRQATGIGMSAGAFDRILLPEHEDVVTGGLPGRSGADRIWNAIPAPAFATAGGTPVSGLGQPVDCHARQLRALPARPLKGGAGSATLPEPQRGQGAHL